MLTSKCNNCQLSAIYDVIDRPNDPKNKLKGGQKDNIDNIEENNAVGVLKLLQYVQVHR